jgi:hypothetical protein
MGLTATGSNCFSFIKSKGAISNMVAAMALLNDGMI